jgi:hypothetical protein
MEHTDSHTPSAAGQQPASATSDTSVTAAPSADTPVAPVDAHGFDPTRYDWVPVLKKKRHDGWSPEKQRRFIEVLADTGNVTRAARAVGMSRDRCYALRRSPGAENFDRAWDAALAAASRQLIDVAFERAIDGVEEPVFSKEGQRIACRTRYNDRLLMFLMRAHAPAVYRHANRDQRDGDEALPPPAPAVADVLRLLEPETPAEPQALMPPDQLEDALLCADILDGKLPHWRRDPDPHRVPQATAAEKQVDALLDAARAQNAAESAGEDGDDDYEDEDDDFDDEMDAIY